MKLENEEYLLRCDATAQIEQIKKLTLAVTDLALLGEPRIAYTLHYTLSQVIRPGDIP